jgi:penicillin-binding protein A
LQACCSSPTEQTPPNEEAELNRQIIRLTYVALILVGALVVGTTYWQTWAAASLADKQDNAVKRVAEFSIDRGLILAKSPFRRLARNVQDLVGGKTLYFRRYPQRALTAQVVGYSTVGKSRTGLERSLNDYLTSSNANLSTLVAKAVDELRGKTVQGNNVVLNLDLAAQRVALEQLGRNCGAVVALDPRTGKVLAMASSPSYDPNLVENHYQAISRITANCRPASPLLNRATAGLFTPGSAFKVITASAALESKKFTPGSHFYDPGYCIVYGKHVNNFGAESGGPEVFGDITLADGLVHSVNSVYCKIGLRLGARRILETAKRFGFYEIPPLETPVDERRASGLYKNGRLWYPSRDSEVDAGRMAFGQERMLVTPLQMAMVAGAIGNRGGLMQPQLVDRIVSPKGHTILKRHPKLIRHAVSPGVAREVADMMRNVVLEGTGTAAQIPGYSVGGKTGTAETGIPGVNTTWFIAFAGKDESSPPEVAVAVVLQNQSGVGGTTAAPIARAVMEAILSSRKNP